MTTNLKVTLAVNIILAVTIANIVSQELRSEISLEASRCLII